MKWRHRSKNKFSASKTEVDGIKFDSQLEAKYYKQLKLMREAGEVQYFLRQVPFDLPGNVKYRVDFMVFYTDGTLQYIDVKGMLTELFIVKKKQVEQLYGVVIDILTKKEIK